MICLQPIQIPQKKCFVEITKNFKLTTSIFYSAKNKSFAFLVYTCEEVIVSYIQRYITTFVIFRGNNSHRKEWNG